MQYAAAGDATNFDSVQMEPILGNYEASNDDWTATCVTGHLKRRQ